MKQLLTTAPSISLPAPDIEVTTWVNPWTRVLPLWRYGVWLALLVEGLGLAVLQREAQPLNERLRLEWDVRRRTEAMEGLAGQLQLTADASMVRVGRAP